MTQRGEVDVLIAGAGPTGLVLALWLRQLGVRIRIVDQTAEAGTTSRALAVQARTLEFYRQIGLSATAVARGRRTVAANLWIAGKRVAHAVLGEMGTGLSPFPYTLILPQDEHERLLIERLGEAGLQVERRTTLTAFEDKGGHILAQLQLPDGTLDTCKAAYLAGCDGARSLVRQCLHIDFPGGMYDHLFYVADVQASGAAINGELHIALDTSDFLAVFPLKAQGQIRLVGTVLQQAVELPKDLSWNDVSTTILERIGIDVARANWFSTYHVHHRVAAQFRQGRAFLLGDAAHIHSPVGGQGMNTGIGDAVNLAWKLAAVLSGGADASLLESYEPERIAFARRLVATTDRAFTAVTSGGAISRSIRLHLVPRLLAPLYSLHSARRLMFRTVSQTAVNYRHSILSEGRAGGVRGGDRLPWVESQDNFAPLTSLGWQVHIYGLATVELQAFCADHRLPLHVFDWDSQVRRAGLRRNAVYLVRPDGYVALAQAAGNASAVSRYLKTRGLHACASQAAHA